MDTPENSQARVWHPSLVLWLLILSAGALLTLIFFSGIKLIVIQWSHSEEYGYGFLIPFITAFLIWQRKNLLEKLAFDGSWLGLATVLLGIALFFAGQISTLFIIMQYALLVVILGLALALTGRGSFRWIWAPLTLLLFMIPLPNFLFQGMSTHLELISSQLGVGVIRLFSIPVLLEGNVIDLGVFKLQVVQACSGLRYLLPLMTLGFIAGYFFKGAFWKKALIFLSSVPITVFMNSFRIGMVGITVEYWGRPMAEGFLHYFEGWVIFMACTGILVAEMWVLSRFGRDKLPLRDSFGVELPEPTSKDSRIEHQPISRPFIISLILLVVVAGLKLTLPQRTEIVPNRQSFSDFPTTVGQWHGRDTPLQQIYINALKFDDYIMADYSNPKGDSVNFYVAYYASQRAGDSAHSPRSCIPGGGWEINSLSQRSIPGVMVAGQPLRVNRVAIEMGDNKELVYYWFQEQGRIVTNEYLVKWYLFWDALTRNRTDGALVRLVTFVQPGEDMQIADRRLVAFTRVVVPQLKHYLPQ